MNWKTEAYSPLLDRTPENLMVQYLARFFDYGKESKVARDLVRFFQQRAQDLEDKKFGIKRVRPGEVIVHLSQSCTLHLPLFSHQDIVRSIEGIPFNTIKKDVVRRCGGYCEALGFPMDTRFLCQLVHWGELAIKDEKCPGLGLTPRHKPTFPVQSGDRHAEMYAGYAQGILKQTECLRGKSAPDRQVMEIIGVLTKEIMEEFALPKRIVIQLVEDLMNLREQCFPREKALENGQMVMIVNYARERLSMEQTTRLRRMVPVVLSILTPEELSFINAYFSEHRRMPMAKMVDLQSERMARVMVEAYAQDGLLSLVDLQWLFLITYTSISRYLSLYESIHHVVLPCPGSVLDSGRSFTHKKIIIQLYLEGYSVDEISRKTYHSPRSVDNYINTFDSVLILHLFDMPDKLMARVLNRGYSLICEYLDLISEHMKTVENMKKYLEVKGIPFTKLAYRG
jgi:hypothetical protein